MIKLYQGTLQKTYSGTKDNPITELTKDFLNILSNYQNETFFNIHGKIILIPQ